MIPLQNPTVISVNVVRSSIFLLFLKSIWRALTPLPAYDLYLLLWKYWTTPKSDFCIDWNNEFLYFDWAGVDPFEWMNVADCGDVHLNMYNVNEACEDITNRYSQLIKDGCIPLTMGGEHTISYPILTAIKVGFLILSSMRCRYLLLVWKTFTPHDRGRRSLWKRWGDGTKNRQTTVQVVSCLIENQFTFGQLSLKSGRVEGYVLLSKSIASFVVEGATAMNSKLIVYNLYIIYHRWVALSRRLETRYAFTSELTFVIRRMRWNHETKVTSPILFFT